MGLLDFLKGVFGGNQQPGSAPIGSGDELVKVDTPGAEAAAEERFERKVGPIPPGRPKIACSVGEVPEAAGIYYVVTKQTRRPVYIGMSLTNMRSRIRAHRASGKYLPQYHDIAYKVARDGAPHDDIRKRERVKIGKHNPARNGRAGGAGGPPGPRNGRTKPEEPPPAM